MKRFQNTTALAAASLAIGQFVETYNTTGSDGLGSRYLIRESGYTPVPAEGDVTLANGNHARFLFGLDRTKVTNSNAVTNKSIVSGSSVTAALNALKSQQDTNTANIASNTSNFANYYTSAQVDAGFYSQSYIDTNLYTQAQVDAAIAAAVPVEYIGHITAASAWVKQPAGWSVLDIGLGKFQITHNLGHTSYIVIPSVESVDTVSDAQCSWYNIAANTFEIHTGRNSSPGDRDFMFIVKDYS